MQVLIRQARVIDPQSFFHDQTVDLLVNDGIITQIAPSVIADADLLIEAANLMVSTGWVDVFTDYHEPGYEQKETIETGINAAAAGGFTDVMLAPNTQPAINSKSLVESVLHKARGKAVNIYPMGCATQNIAGKDLAEMMDMRQPEVLAFTDGWKPIQNADLCLKVLQYIKAFHGVLVQIPVDANLASDGLMNEGTVSIGLGMAGIPTLAETIFLHRDIELLRYSESKLHVSGISTAESVAMIRKAKTEGLQITCSVTPYHLALTDEALMSYDSVYKVSPPLRTETDRLALIEGLKDGTIDCIATHHNPQEWDAKTKEFEYASGGMAIQESAFNILWDSLKDNISIDRLIETMTIIPRDIFGMETKSVGIGNIASLTLFSTYGKYTLNGERVRSKSRNNPFIDIELSGKVIGIMNNKQLILNK